MAEAVLIMGVVACGGTLAGARHALRAANGPRAAAMLFLSGLGAAAGPPAAYSLHAELSREERREAREAREALMGAEQKRVGVSQPEALHSTLETAAFLSVGLVGAPLLAAGVGAGAAVGLRGLLRRLRRRP